MTTPLSIALLILAALPAGSIPGPAVGKPGAERFDHPSYAADELAYRGDFGPDGDRNHNGWPDDWRRRVGPGFPRYVTMSLADDAGAPGGHAVRVELNGAAATAYSPTIAVSPEHVYTLLVAVKTENVRRDQASVSLRLLDREQKLLSENVSAPVAGDTPWRLLRVGPLAIDDPSVRFAVVGLHVQPGEPADLAGSVSFAEARVLRQPRLRVTTNQPFNLFAADEPVKIACQASGLPAMSAGRHIRLSLELGRRVTDPLEYPLTQDWDLPAGTDKAPPASLAWSPRLPGPGHYRLRARLLMDAADQPIAGSSRDGRYDVGRLSTPPTTARVLIEHETSLVVVPRLAGRSSHGAGSFGWSLARADEEIPPARLADLADRSGVAVIKMPVWDEAGASSEKQHPKSTASRRLLDALAARDVRVVGVLADPSARVRKALFDDPAADASVASLLAAPATKLRPQLEAVITPLALQIRGWQLGADTDRSLAGSQGPLEALRELQAGLAKDGLPVRLALPAPFSPRKEITGEGGGERLTTYLIPSTLTPTEIQSALRDAGTGSQRTWLSIEPPPSDGRPFVHRAADFAQRLVIAGCHAENVFVHDALNPSHGLLNPDGCPGDLLLPWRTVAGQLSGAKLLGRLQLPGGSENAVWEREGQFSLVLWSGEPRTERLFVGHGAKRLDIHGQVTGLPSEGSEQLVAVGPAPVFIIGVDAAVVRTQLAVAVEPSRLPSIPSLPQQIRVRVPNCFGRAIAGKVTLHLPDRWRVTSARSLAIDLPAGGGEAVVPFQVRLPLDGASGPQRVRVEVEIAGDAPLRFTIERQLSADGGDIELTATARLDQQGNLIVRQQLTNHGATTVGFTCQLSIPGRRPQRITLRPLSPGTHEHVYTVPDGRDISDKQLRLRADEIGGPRVLSQSLIVAR